MQDFRYSANFPAAGSLICQKWLATGFYIVFSAGKLLVIQGGRVWGGGNRLAENRSPLQKRTARMDTAILQRKISAFPVLVPFPFP